MAIRLTKQLESSLNRARGVGEELLTAAGSTAERALGAMTNALDNSNISVLADNIKDSVEKNFQEASQQISEAAQDPAEALIGLGTTANIAQVLGKTENQLKAYASYTYNITLACLTVNEVNFPDSTYRAGPPQVTILRSGGGAPNKARTAYESSDAELEYFIDDLEINAVVTPTTRTRTSNATTIGFSVIEPYSMGLFLQTLMIAANKAGHADYLKSPYALIIEFKGYDDFGRIKSVDDTSRRVFPIKISKVDFDVNGSGSRYNIRAYAWNEGSLMNTTQSMATDTTITGDNLQEMLQGGPESLTGVINRRIREKAEERNTVNKDEYIIMFPGQLVSSLGLGNQADTPGDAAPSMTAQSFYRRITGANYETLLDFEEAAAEEGLENYINLTPSNNNIGATVKRMADNPALSNAIGRSNIDQGMATGGSVPFGRESFAKDPNSDVYRQDRIEISNSFRTMQFPQGTTIEQIIEECVVISTYAKQSAAEMQVDSDGMVDWFRIHTQTFLMPDESVRRITGENPKVFVYAVVPYKVHSSVFGVSSAPSVGVEERVQQAAKKYSYIYTGENDDIIDFEINFNSAFFAAISPKFNGSGDNKLGTRDGTNNPNNANLQAREGAEGPNSTTGSGVLREVPNFSQTGGGGGTTTETPEVQIARQFNEAIVNNDTDLVTLELTILGDPYFLADSGQGNYSSPAVAKAYTADGTMDYQRSEVEVVVTFRTPIDYNRAGGGMLFPEQTVPVEAFSGLYKVTTVINNFSGGKFTQVLSLIRRKNQESDIGTAGTGDQAGITESTGSEGNNDNENQNPPPANSGGSGATPANATGSGSSSVDVATIDPGLAAGVT